MVWCSWHTCQDQRNMSGSKKCLLATPWGMSKYMKCYQMAMNARRDNMPRNASSKVNPLGIGRLQWISSKTLVGECHPFPSNLSKEFVARRQELLARTWKCQKNILLTPFAHLLVPSCGVSYLEEKWVSTSCFAHPQMTIKLTLKLHNLFTMMSSSWFDWMQCITTGMYLNFFKYLHNLLSNNNGIWFLNKFLLGNRQQLVISEWSLVWDETIMPFSSTKELWDWHRPHSPQDFLAKDCN